MCLPRFYVPVPCSRFQVPGFMFHVPGSMFLSCSRYVHDLFPVCTCSRFLVPGMYMTCSRYVHDLFPVCTCSRFCVPGMYMFPVFMFPVHAPGTCSRLILMDYLL